MWHPTHTLILLQNLGGRNHLLDFAINGNTLSSVKRIIRNENDIMWNAFN
jgi:hypothetical protein